MLQNLLTPQKVESGIGDYFLFAPMSWFAPGGIKKPDAGSIVIEEDFVFKNGYGFIKIGLAPRKNQLLANTIGDLGFNKLEFNLDVFIPGSYIEQHEQLKNMLNTPMVALCYDDNCPIEYHYVIGNECEAAYFTCDFSTGFSHEGSKGYSAKIITTARKIYYYAGEINIIGTYVLATEGNDFLVTEDNQKIELEFTL